METDNLDSIIQNIKNSKTLYDVLGISFSATQDEIKKSFVRISKIIHPDKSGRDTGSEFHRLHEAYKTLSEPYSRQGYDKVTLRNYRFTSYPPPPFARFNPNAYNYQSQPQPQPPPPPPSFYTPYPSTHNFKPSSNSAPPPPQSASSSVPNYAKTSASTNTTENRHASANGTFGQTQSFQPNGQGTKPPKHFFKDIKPNGGTNVNNQPAQPIPATSPSPKRSRGRPKTKEMQNQRTKTETEKKDEIMQDIETDTKKEHEKGVEKEKENLKEKKEKVQEKVKEKEKVQEKAKEKVKETVKEKVKEKVQEKNEKQQTEKGTKNKRGWEDSEDSDDSDDSDDLDDLDEDEDFIGTDLGGIDERNIIWGKRQASQRQSKVQAILKSKQDIELQRYASSKRLQPSPVESEDKLSDKKVGQAQKKKETTKEEKEENEEDEVIPHKLSENKDSEEEGQSDSAEYEVEKVVGKRSRRGQVEYLLKFLGYSSDENMWTDKKLCACNELIEEFEKEQEEIAKRRGEERRQERLAKKKQGLAKNNEQETKQPKKRGRKKQKVEERLGEIVISSDEDMDEPIPTKIG